MYKQLGERRYWVEDLGNGAPLLLLHGFTGTTHTFNGMIDELTEEYRLIKIDLPGHGQTGPIGVVTMEEFCGDLSALLEELGLPEVSILGYSLGGRTALSFANLFPEKVTRLFLESSSPGLATSEEQLARQVKDQALATMLDEQGLTAFVDYWERIPLFDSQVTLPESTKKQIRDERLQHQALGLQESLMGMGTGAQPSWWDQLNDIHVPVILITGKLDQKFQNINQLMEQKLRQVEWIEVDDAGHAIHLEKPRIFAKIVDTFMIQ
ncbi:2-succinyl-6-hydroxy-2,4-cyclohexadiene-1-carboxylate synthase [Halobacillus locisalis]|uniref:Putative 2-succinyl-6-hydroxy-2,4-cyclohexadiene-1-carboxylate synthase n=2 Tax=Halobacillus locisalis TaxID=220753 RepID=A0A838CV24_9BACI|nr:2-succinyl-6-hydroxy-2,4-cyclohexadiene-1-carboxylate synthase [Halobacillus locisalis]